MGVIYYSTYVTVLDAKARAKAGARRSILGARQHGGRKKQIRYCW